MLRGGYRQAFYSISSAFRQAGDKALEWGQGGEGNKIAAMVVVGTEDGERG